MAILSFLPFLILLLPMELRGQEHNHTQELNYTKALIAYNEKNYHKAMEYLAPNLSSKLPFHQDTLELIAKIHEEKKEPLKALRTYYVLVKHYHRRDLLKEKQIENIRKLIKEEKEDGRVVSERVKGYYLKMADLFVTIFESTAIEKKRIRQITSHLALKYYEICRIYEVSPSVVEYKMGLLNRLKGDHRVASEHFTQAQEKSLESIPDPWERQEFQKTIELYLADTSIKNGNFDLALRYLKSIPLSLASDSLKNYAHIYQNALEESALSLNASYNYGHNSNANGISRTDRNQFASLADYYGSVSGNYDQKSFYALYTSKANKTGRFHIGFNAKEQLYKEEGLSRNDSRSFGAEAEGRLFWGARGVFKLNTQFTRNYFRDFREGSLKHANNTLNITPGLDLWTSWGVLGLSSPFTHIYDRNEERESLEYGVGMSVSPLGGSIYFSPTFSFTATHFDGGELSSDGRRLRASVGNLSQVHDKISLFASLAYSKDITNDPLDQYDTYGAGLVGLYDLTKLLTGLFFELSYNYNVSYASWGHESFIEQQILAGGLSLSF